MITPNLSHSCLILGVLLMFCQKELFSLPLRPFAHYSLDYVLLNWLSPSSLKTSSIYQTVPKNYWSEEDSLFLFYTYGSFFPPFTSFSVLSVMWGKRKETQFIPMFQTHFIARYSFLLNSLNIENFPNPLHPDNC